MRGQDQGVGAGGHEQDSLQGIGAESRLDESSDFEFV